MYDFAYHQPTSLDEAVKLLGKGEDAKLIAGGQSYLPTLKQRLAMPTDLIDLGSIDELKGIREEGDGITIGAMTIYSDILRSELVQSRIPGLIGLVEYVGDPQVRNLGTIGGSIANSDPAADWPAAIVALNTTIRTSKREIAADDFFTGLFETALEDDEIVTAVHFPVPEKAAYEKFANPASRYAICGVMVAKTKSGEVRVAVTGAGPFVFRWKAAEEALSSDWSVGALEPLTVEATDLNSDLHASAAYRAHLVKVMARRALEKTL